MRPYLDIDRLAKIADGGEVFFKSAVDEIVTVTFKLRGHPWQCQYDSDNRGLYGFKPTGFEAELDAIEALLKG